MEAARGREKLGVIFIGYRVSVCDDENILEMNRGDSCSTVKYLLPLVVYLIMAKIVTLMYILSQLKKCWVNGKELLLSLLIIVIVHSKCKQLVTSKSWLLEELGQTSLVAQWFRLWASTARGMILIPGWGTKIMNTSKCGQRNNRNYILEKEWWENIPWEGLVRDNREGRNHQGMANLKRPRVRLVWSKS